MPSLMNYLVLTCHHIFTLRPHTWNTWLDTLSVSIVVILQSVYILCLITRYAKCCLILLIHHLSTWCLKTHGDIFYITNVDDMETIGQALCLAQWCHIALTSASIRILLSFFTKAIYWKFYKQNSLSIKHTTIKYIWFWLSIMGQLPFQHLSILELICWFIISSIHLWSRFWHDLCIIFGN